MRSITKYLIPDSERKYTPGDLFDYDAIAAIIKDDDNRILLQKHNKYGFWTIPIGKVDPGETREYALKKEMREECNINVIDYKLIGQKKFKYIRMGKLINVDSFLYEIIKYSGKIKNNEPTKHAEQKFMSVDEITKLNEISHMTQMYLKMLGKLPKHLDNLSKIM